MLQSNAQAASSWALIGRFIVEALPWLIPSLLAVLGWLALYRGQVVSQRQAFLIDTRRSAWQELHRATLEYQKQLLNLTSGITFLAPFLDGKGAEELAGSTAVSLARQWSETVSGDASMDWIFLMEDFEVLFPAMASLRLQFVNIQMLIEQDMSASRRLMFVPSHDEKPTVGSLSAALEPARQRLPLLCDQMSLLRDLLIYLQNFVFAGLTHYSVPARNPKPPLAVRLGFAENDRGHRTLHIMDGYGTIHDAAISQQSTSFVEPDWLPKDPPSC